MSDRTQGQPRIVPTRPGWWWARWAGMNAEMVWSENIDGAHPAWEWIAPIPGPEVCAALARYAEAEPPRVTPGGPPVYQAEWLSACEALNDAIRAERGAA